MSSIQYRPEVDGLRSIAVGAVVLFHLGLEWISGGFLGVDVFFVISGYLITSIILRDLEGGTFKFSTFWARRVRRIAPAMLAVTAVTMAVVFAIGFKGLHPSVGSQALATLLSVANFYFYKQAGDYWGPAAEHSPFLHTWSLAVEEQFYLVLPVTLFIIYKRWPRSLLGAMLAGFTASLALFLYEYPGHPTGTFYLLPTRAWELAAGSVLAVLAASGFTPKPEHGALATAGLALIVASCFLVTGLSAGMLVPVLGTTLVLAFGQVGGIANKLLSAPPVVYLGRISYSLYLWHWPIIVLPEQLDIQLSRWAAVPLMLALSVASYHWVEQTTRGAKRTVPVALGCMAVAAVLAFGLARSSGTYDTSRFNKVTYHGFYFDLKPDNFDYLRTDPAHSSMNLPARVAPLDAYLTGGIILGPKKDAPDVVLFGDSHGVMWSNTVRTATEQLGLTTSFYSMDGIAPFFEVPPDKNQVDPFMSSDEKFKFDNARIDFVRKWKPKVVIITARWVDVTDWDLVRTTIAFLRKEAHRVIMIGQPPELAFHERLAVDHLCYLGVPAQKEGEILLPLGNEDKVMAANGMAQKIAGGYFNVKFLATADLYRRGNRAVALKDNNVVYYDDNHLSAYGSAMVVPRLVDALKFALKQ